MNGKEFRVIKIIDDIRIVINGGSNDGLKRGDELEIFAPGQPVHDLDGTLLGNLDLVKAYVTIATALPQMSVCVNTDTRPASDVMAALIQMNTGGHRIPCPLHVNAKEITGGWLKEDDREIRLGDPVRRSSKMLTAVSRVNQ